MEGTSHHLVQFLTLLQEAGLLALHLEPFKMLSGSASEERNPTVLWLTQCVFYSRSQEIGYFLSRLLGAEGGLSHLWDGNLYECLPPGLKGEYKVPWMLSNKKQRMPNKSPVHFSLLQLESYFTFSLWLLWIPPAAGCAALENTPTPCISLLLIN